MQCKKFGFEAEPEGHCESWEAPDGADNEVNEMPADNEGFGDDDEADGLSPMG